MISFFSRPGSPVARYNGIDVDSTKIIRFSPGTGLFTHSSGFVAASTMSLLLDDMATIGAAMIGCDPSKPKNHLVVVPPPPMVAKLRRLHGAAITLAEDAPGVITQPDAARGLEQALIEAMMGCLANGEVGEDRAALRQHAAIMRRFYGAIERHLDEPLYIPELCKEIGTSLRTLNACCQEHLGMGPKRYLLLRRMNLFRRALREGSPSETTVTETATRYGFWQFGRLAVEYKALFGEAPSATIARPA
jgi:AraC-like DNA-binding protein